MGLDFMAASTEDISMYYLTYNLGAKFFFDKKAVTPKGFYLEASMLTSYVYTANVTSSCVNTDNMYTWV